MLQGNESLLTVAKRNPPCTLFIWKEDRAEIHCPMQHMHDFDDFSFNAVEYRVIAVNDATDTGVLVARDKCEPAWRKGQGLALEFTNKRNGARRIVLSSGVANPFQVDLLRLQ
jgi:hypothetical protein